MTLIASRENFIQIKSARYKKTSYHGLTLREPYFIEIRMGRFFFWAVLFHSVLFNPNILHQYQAKKEHWIQKDIIGLLKAIDKSNSDTSRWSWAGQLFKNLWAPSAGWMSYHGRLHNYMNLSAPATSTTRSLVSSHRGCRPRSESFLREDHSPNEQRVDGYTQLHDTYYLTKSWLSSALSMSNAYRCGMNFSWNMIIWSSWITAVSGSCSARVIYSCSRIPGPVLGRFYVRAVSFSVPTWSASWRLGDYLSMYNGYIQLCIAIACQREKASEYWLIGWWEMLGVLIYQINQKLVAGRERLIRNTVWERCHRQSQYFLADVDWTNLPCWSIPRCPSISYWIMYYTPKIARHSTTPALGTWSGTGPSLAWNRATMCTCTRLLVSPRCDLLFWAGDNCVRSWRRRQTGGWVDVSSLRYHDM